MEEIEIKSSRNYLLLNLFTLAVPVILYPLITKSINPSEFGNYIFIQAIATFIIAISNLGCLIGFKRNYFECRSELNKYKLLNSIQLFILIILFFIVSINFYFEDYIFKKITQYSGKSYWGILMLAISLDFISKYYLSFLVNEKKSYQYCIFLFLKNFLYLFLALFLLFNNYQIFSLVYSLLVANVIIFLFILIYQIRYNKIVFSIESVLNVLKISYPLIFRILLGQLNTKIDKIIITLLSVSANTGIYAIAQSIAYFIFQLTTSLDKVFITELNKKLFSGITNIKNYLTPYLYISALSALFIILFNDIIYFFLIDERYYGAENIIILLSLYYFSLFFGKIYGTQIIYLKKTWFAGNIFLLSIVINFFMSIFFINLIGFEGVAIATLFSSLIVLVIQKNYCKKFLNIKYERFGINFILISMVVISFFQYIIINNYEFNVFSIFLIVKVIIFILFIYLIQKLKFFDHKKFIYNFFKK